MTVNLRRVAGEDNIVFVEHDLEAKVRYSSTLAPCAVSDGDPKQLCPRRKAYCAANALSGVVHQSL